MAANQLDTFVTWLQAEGVCLDRIAIITAQDGSRSVVAKQMLHRGERLLVIPDKLFMSETMAKASPLGHRFAAQGLVSSQHQLAALLLQHKTLPDSGWRAYLDALPQSYAEMPANNISALMAILRGTRALNILNYDVATALRDFHDALNFESDFADKNFKAYAWARIAVYSRSWTSQTHGIDEAVMVPLMDLFNHALWPALNWQYSAIDQGMVLSLLRDVRAGEELTVSYGRHPNSVLFAKYGFVLHDNPVKESVVYLPPDSRACCVRQRYEDAETRATFGRLRALHANEAELQHINAQRPSPANIGPLSVRNERLVLGTLRSAAEASLTSMQRASSARVGEPRLACLLADAQIVRRDEMQVLQALIDLADMSLELLNGSRGTLRDTLLAQGERLVGARHYLTEIAALADDEAPIASAARSAELARPTF